MGIPLILEGEVLSVSPFPFSRPTAGPIVLSDQPFQTPQNAYQPNHVPDVPRNAPDTPFNGDIEGTYYNKATGQRYYTPASQDTVNPFTGRAYSDLSDEALYSGLDELSRANNAVTRETALGQAGRTAVGELGGAALGGLFDGYNTYQQTGSGFQAAGSGVGSTLGSVAGATLGSFAGPVGTVAGGIVGGFVGEAIGQAIGALFDPNNTAANGPPQNVDLTPAFTGGQCFDVGYRFEWTFTSNRANYTTSITVRGPVSVYLEVSNPQSDGTSFYNWILRQNDGNGGNSLSSLGAVRDTSPPGLRVNVTRLDGLPDTCGSPEPTIPVETPVDTKPFFRTDEYGKPVDFKPIPKNPLTGAPRLPAPTLPTFPIPVIPNPTGEPDLQPDPYSDPNPNPPSNPFPDIDPNPFPPDTQPPLYRDPPNSDCLCNIPVLTGIEQLKRMIEQIELNGGFEFNGANLYNANCDDSSTALFDSLEGALTQLSYQIKQVKQGVCDLDITTATPESFAIKTGSKPPQLVLVFALNAEHKGSARWSVTIPHPVFSSAGEAVDAISGFIYEKGSTMLNIQLSDNSQCIFNCKSVSEANRVWSIVRNWIQPQYWIQDEPKITMGVRRNLANVEVIATHGKFYSNADISMLPDWIAKF